ncbi:sugar ABC transporter substrate-binding protein [Frondihabitans sp. VKM Ac-2883]|uniref:ABC transporter substrate-binding protein n=1 Tax=Frondihabitans sp. VKM Ac-2883 TaxID=2783823 RepID=UPI00188B86C6|nr:sugar ABC transporter substrate-binding protein [Frondihabitans sp. VKM Ac-2883]MBF4575999.1 sugar ABC transporter substrate-binding protein [Frondihabitans sp. VKM Ac-2883]
MRTTTKWLAAVAVGAMTIGGMTACSSSSGGDANSTKTLTYWASNQAPTIQGDQKILKAELAKFTEETGIKVNIEVIPWTNLYNKILTAVSSGDGPDVLSIGNTWATSLQSSGAFVPFEGDALKAIGGKDKFVASSYATGGAEGKAPTSVPLYGLSYSMYYNTKMFKAAGIDTPPATWDEFVADAKKLTKDTDGDGQIDQWGVTMAGSSVSNNAHQAFVRGLQNGGALYDADGKPTFASDGEVKGIKQWVDLIGADKVVNPSDAESVNGSDMAATFADGKAAMFFDQAPGASLAARNFTDYAAAPVPMETADATGLLGTQSHVAGINLSIFKNTGNLSGSEKLVKFMTSVPAQQSLNKSFASIPVVTDAYDDPAFKTAAIKLKQEILKDHAQPMPLQVSEGQMETLVGTAIKNLLAQAAQGKDVSESDVKSALEDANSQMTASQ